MNNADTVTINQSFNHNRHYLTLYVLRVEPALRLPPEEVQEQ